MFKKIGDKIAQPAWVKKCPRYKRLDLLDRLLDGTFYDHLKFAFYDETDESHRDELVRIEDRRPSAQFRLPRMVARWTSRKLFAGRHIPRIVHADKDFAKRVSEFAEEHCLWRTMLEAALRGSVGSVAVTFTLNKVGGEIVGIICDVWKAKYCWPTFDAARELDKLRVCYPITRAAAKSMGATDLPEDSDLFWYIRDFTKDGEITYRLVKFADWDPVDEFGSNTTLHLVEWEERTKSHDLGFVAGHWFQNLTGGEVPDGACTFEDAIPDSIELDYNLSQIGRGVRYNSAPQVVVRGELSNPVTRGPTYVLQVRAGMKDPEGYTYGDGDAKLLEMSGQGTTAALALVDKLRNFALEQISANRKDAEKMKGPLSGRAMEYLDDDAHDLVAELRNSYGAYGALCLLRKMVRAAMPDADNMTSGIKFRWPRLYQPTPQDLAQLLPALVGAVYPAPPAGGGAGPDGTAATPKPLPGLISLETATAYILNNMDMDILDDQPDQDDELDDDADDDPGQRRPPELEVPPVATDIPGEFDVTGSPADVDAHEGGGSDPGA